VLTLEEIQGTSKYEEFTNNDGDPLKKLEDMQASTLRRKQLRKQKADALAEAEVTNYV
jgi:hypothetical protein